MIRATGNSYRWVCPAQHRLVDMICHLIEKHMDKVFYISHIQIVSMCKKWDSSLLSWPSFTWASTWDNHNGCNAQNHHIGMSSTRDSLLWSYCPSKLCIEYQGSALDLQRHSRSQQPPLQILQPASRKISLFAFICWESLYSIHLLSRPVYGSREVFLLQQVPLDWWMD